MVIYTDSLVGSPEPRKEALKLPFHLREGRGCPPDEAAELSLGLGPQPSPQRPLQQVTPVAHRLTTANGP